MTPTLPPTPIRPLRPDLELKVRHADGIGASVPKRLKVTICGSFSRDLDQIREAIEQFNEHGVTVLSPKSAELQESGGGFGYVYGDTTRSRRATEDRHLAAIRHSDFIWLQNGDGKPGTATLIEAGYALRCGIPIYTRNNFADHHLEIYVQPVSSPRDAIRTHAATHRTKASAIDVLLHPEAAITALRSEIEVMEQLLTRSPNAFVDRHDVQLRKHWRRARQILEHPSE